MSKDNITETVDHPCDPDKDPEAKSDTGQLPRIAVERKNNEEYTPEKMDL